MNSTERLAHLAKRLNAMLMVYIVVCVLHQYAHGLIDMGWTTTGQMTFLIIFGVVPMVAAFLLWSSAKRFGAIIALGSVPASVLFLVLNRYIDKHQCLYPIEFSDVWVSVYEATFYLLALSAVVVSVFAVQFLKELHAGLQPPVSDSP